MKTLNFELLNENLNEFVLSNEEMINVRGGYCDGGEPILLPNEPPIII